LLVELSIEVGRPAEIHFARPIRDRDLLVPQ
jgi:hypothetical protein